MSLIGKNVLFRRLGSEEVFMGEVVAKYRGKLYVDNEVAAGGNCLKIKVWQYIAVDYYMICEREADDFTHVPAKDIVGLY